MHDAANNRLVAQSWSGPLAPPESLPPAADVVIIGGGIIGICTAWYLARQGVDVVVCEKGHIAGEQSGRNWGWVRQQGRDTREMPMIVESLRIWRGLAEELGEDTGFRETGVLFAARSEAQLAEYAAWIATAREYGLDTRLLDRDALRALTPGAAADWHGALYTASDGRAEPHLATAAIARAAVRAGARVLTACAVRGIETAAGSVCAVVTEHGVIRTGRVLCAAGAWTSMFCRSLGVPLPQLRVRNTVARTLPADNVLDGALFDDRIAIRRRNDGGYTLAAGFMLEHSVTPASFRYGRLFWPALKMEIRNLRLRIGREFFDELKAPASWPLDGESPFERQRVLDPAPGKAALRKIRRNLDELYPQLAGVGFAETWAGIIETTPDVIPVIGEVDEWPGFYVASGFSGHGFGIGPGAGKAIAGLLNGRDVGIDLSPFRLGRFFDGTPLQLQSSL